MADDTNKYVFDITDALQSIERLKGAFQQQNSALGQVTAAMEKVTVAGNVMTTTFTQIDSQGRKITTTLRGEADAFDVLTQKITAATRAAQQNRAATGLAPGAPPASRGGAAGTAPPGLPPTSTGGPIGVPFGGGGNINPTSPRQLLNILQQTEKQFNTLTASTNAFQNALNFGGRILLYQLLHTAFSTIIQDMQLAITTAADFQRQLGLIRTISQDSGNSLNEFRDEISAIAKEFGRPVADVAKAAYQGISNQVLNTTKDFGLLRQAVAFSRVADTDATAAIDLFSSAINSFNLNATDGQRIAAGFFKTIDLGRVTGKDLANTFGIIGPLAQQVGLSFEETDAAIAKITQSGIKTDVALTLAANALKAFIKPSKEFQEVLNKTGFPSGEELIAARSFEGALKTIVDQAHGSSTELAKLFEDFRELRGIIALSSNGVKTFNENLKEIKGGGDDFNKALKEMKENAGQKFYDELNRVKNFFTEEFGGNVLKKIIAVTDQFGGLVNITRTMTDTVIFLGEALIATFLAGKLIAFTQYLSTAFVLFQNLSTVIPVVTRLSIAFGTSTATAMGLATAGVGILLAGLVNLIVKLDNAKEELEQAFKFNLDSAKAEFTKITEVLQAETSRQEEIVLEGQKAQRAAFLETVATVQRSLNEIRSGQSAAYKGILGDLKNNIDSLEGTLKGNLSNITNAQKAAQREVAKASEDGLNVQNKASGDLFQNELSRLKAYQNANERTAAIIESTNSKRQLAIRNALKAQSNVDSIADAGGGAGSVEALKKAADTAKKANDLIQKTPLPRQTYGNPQQLIAQLVASRVELLKSQSVDLVNVGNIDEARNRLKEAEGILKSIGNETANINGRVVKLYDVRKQISDLTSFQLSLDQQIADQKLKEVEALRTLKQEEEGRIRKIQDLFGQIEKFKLADKEGKLLPEFKTPAAAGEALKKLQTQVIDLVGATQILNNPGLLKDFAQELAAVQSGLKEQSSALAGQISTANAQQNIDELRVKYNQFSEASSTANKNLFTNIKKNQQAINDLSATADAGATTMVAAFRQFDFLGINKPLETDFLKGFKQDLTGGKLDEAIAKIDKLKKGLANVPGITGGDALQGRGGFPGKDTGATLDTIREQLQEARELDQVNKQLKQRAVDNGAAFSQQGAALQQSVSAVIPQFDSMLETMKRIGSEGGTSVGSVSSSFEALSGEAAKAQAAVQALSEAIRAIPPVPNVSPSAGGGNVEQPEGHATGGFINARVGGAISDFLSGRNARGTDTHPIMAATGEYVVRAAAATRFAPQLIAMNHGRDPFSAAQGASSSVNNIDAINVHVNGGSTSTQTLNEIGRGLRRGFKLGTIKLGN